MKVLIIEDDNIYADALGLLLKEMDCKVVDNTGDSTEAIRLIKATKPDLILLDIYLKGKFSGIEIAEFLQLKQLPISVIFITSLLDDATFERAKRTNPFAYINKPLDRLSLQRTITLALQRNKGNIAHPANSWQHEKTMIREQSNFFVKVGHQVQKISPLDVYYIEVDGKYSNIVLKNTSLSVKMPLKELIQQLPNDDFFKANKSCVVNLQKVNSVDISKNVVLIGQYRIPISRSHKKTLLEALEYH